MDWQNSHLSFLPMLLISDMEIVFVIVSVVLSALKKYMKLIFTKKLFLIYIKIKENSRKSFKEIL
jgi:hypothetical protein